MEKCKFLQKYKCRNNKSQTKNNNIKDAHVLFSILSLQAMTQIDFIRVGDKKRPAIEITCTVSGCNDNIG